MKNQPNQQARTGEEAMEQSPQELNISDKQLFKAIGLAFVCGIVGFIVMSLFPYRGPIKLLPATLAFIAFAIVIYKVPES